jgi:hypothetical protein
MDTDVADLLRRALHQFSDTVKLRDKQRRDANIEIGRAVIAHLGRRDGTAPPVGPLVRKVVPFAQERPVNTWLAVMLNAVVAAAFADYYMGAHRRDPRHPSANDVISFAHRRAYADEGAFHQQINLLMHGNTFVGPLSLGMFVAERGPTEYAAALAASRPWTNAHHLWLTSSITVPQMRADVRLRRSIPVAFIESCRGNIAVSTPQQRTSIHRHPLATAGALILRDRVSRSDADALFGTVALMRPDTDVVVNVDADDAASRVLGFISGYIDAVDPDEAPVLGVI